MGLLSSIFSRSRRVDGAAVDPEPADNLTQARTRARQRLIGAVVLVGIGVIGFPLLFETQPRPIPVDVPIEIPRKENAPPLSLPGERPPLATAPSPASTPAEPVARKEPSKPEIVTETAAEAGLEAKPAAVQPSAPAREPVVAAAPATTKPDAKPAPPAAEANRAQAILEGRSTAALPASGPAQARFIVQIGAFADPALARQTRLKVERLGMVTYTHVAQTPNGERTRVRVGPVPTRQEADKLAERLKAAGLPAAILTL